MAFALLLEVAVLHPARPPAEVPPRQRSRRGLTVNDLEKGRQPPGFPSTQHEQDPMAAGTAGSPSTHSHPTRCLPTQPVIFEPHNGDGLFPISEDVATMPFKVKIKGRGSSSSLCGPLCEAQDGDRGLWREPQRLASGWEEAQVSNRWGVEIPLP